jgi:four helix bundle protein
MDLVDAVYQLTASFPSDERYALTQQIRRAAYSIPSNIAEGAARETHKETLRGLYIARGSLAEVETQLLIAQRQHYCDQSPEIEILLRKVSQSLNGYLRYIKTKT